MADEEPTTVAPAPATGAEQALPATEATPAPADSPNAEVSPTTSTEGAATTEALPKEDTATPEVDDKLASFAKGQGIDDVSQLSERELKLLKVAKDNQAEYSRARQATVELEKASTITPDQIPADATPQQRDNVRLRELELRYEAQNWKLTNPDKVALEPEMVDILTKDANKKLLVQEGYLSYDDLYAMAKGNQDNVATVKSEGRREALESLAQSQQAAVPRGNATNTADTPGKKAFKDLSIAEMEAKLGVVRQ